MADVQLQAKEALKTLLTSDDKVIAMLYEKHQDFNQEYFEGELSFPLISFEKMNTKTLATYTAGKNRLRLENHIRFNIELINLNEDQEEAICEVLKHEMIHQWQDECLYTGEKKPKNWHNKDFKAKAEELGVLVQGTNCPIKMPEGNVKNHSYRYVCGCRDEQNKTLVIRTPFPLEAKCKRCGEEFKIFE
ncbi:protein of unknown function SprT [Desulforamulus reducens MI-1]|uniref:SprT-like domain-containing protein n=1 Tax=Desulforamulus reducens (strain ATCC BAA-1160 / DSM 100696 / MI-1) TaxID=349161 RepID=A4J7T3_DESRM|nr:SprT family zinc-dependent metalloprotease [Desulforamulus reducens]ABO51136.1 protein of unknown function SprT [Desulforamulus reducens MI-1]